MSRKHRVFLIVEAGQTGLSRRKMILETAGYNVLSAVTAGDALAMSSQHPTDAVLFDIDVHDLPAPEFVTALKQQKPTRPVFLLASRPWRRMSSKAWWTPCSTKWKTRTRCLPSWKAISTANPEPPGLPFLAPVL